VNREIRILQLETQIFVVHLQLVKNMLKGLREGICQPILIQFPELMLCEDSILTSLKEASKNIESRLEHHGDNDVIQITCEFKLLSSLAGFLLSYPAIYYSENAEAKLVDSEVNVYSVQTNGSEPKILIQFSAPPEFKDTVQESLNKVVEEWQLRITQMPVSSRQAWKSFTGEELCSLQNIQIDTRTAPILSL
jgi:hypothetical protein